MQKILWVFLSLIFVCDAWAAQITPGTGFSNQLVQITPIVGSGVAVDTPSCFDECSVKLDCDDGESCIYNSASGCRVCMPTVAISTCRGACLLTDDEKKWEKYDDDGLYGVPTICRNMYDQTLKDCERVLSGYVWACETGYYLKNESVLGSSVVSCVKCPTIKTINDGDVASTCTNSAIEDGTVCLNTSTSMSSCYLKSGGEYTDDTGTFELAGDCYSR